MTAGPHSMGVLDSLKGRVGRKLVELDRVRITTVVASDEGGVIPAGSKGTVVAVWGGGNAYDVEFTTPIAGLATVRAADLQALRPGD